MVSRVGVSIGPVMNCLLLFLYVDGPVRNCLLLYVLVGTGCVSSRCGFLVWQCAVAWFGDLAGSSFVGSVLT